MKKYLIAAASAAAMISAASSASAQGFVELGYTGAEDVDVLNFGGAAVAKMGPVNVQFDGNVTRLDVDSFNTTLTEGAAHAFARNDSFSAGAFVSVADILGDGLYTFGVEGQKYLGPVTLNGRLSTTSDDFKALDNITAVEVGAKYFFSDNLSVSANYTNLNADFGDADAWGVDVEWKTSGPVSLFASYETVEDTDADVIGIGARWNFGSASLKDRDRSGASQRRGSAVLRPLVALISAGVKESDLDFDFDDLDF